MYIYMSVVAAKIALNYVQHIVVIAFHVTSYDDNGASSLNGVMLTYDVCSFVRPSVFM